AGALAEPAVKESASMSERAEAAVFTSIPIEGGRIEAFEMPGGPGVPLVVLGGVELGFRPLTGTESVLQRRWARRARRRPVTVLGRPLPDDPADAPLLMHPRVIADGVARAIQALGLAPPVGPVGIEAESGGGRISLWLAVEHPELVARLVLSSVARTRSSPQIARARWPNPFPERGSSSTTSPATRSDSHSGVTTKLSRRSWRRVIRTEERQRRRFAWNTSRRRSNRRRPTCAI